MHKLAEVHGVPTTLRATRYLSLRLQSRPESRGLRAEVDGVRASLKEADEAWTLAVDERVAASGEVAYLDSRVDKVVVELGAQVRLDERQGAVSGIYSLLFTKSPSEHVGPVSAREQGAFVSATIRNLRADASLASRYEPYAARLEEAQAALDEAIGVRENLYAAELQAAARRRQAKEQAQRVYNLMYPRLQLLFDQDPALVESFFLELSSRVAEEPSEA